MLYKKRIGVIGCTGSIGNTTLNILKKYPKLFSVELLVTNKSNRILHNQIKIFKPKYIFINNENSREKFLKKNPIYKNNLIMNFNSLIKIFKKRKKLDKVVLGVSSLDGLKYSLECVKFSKEILIANKESIICGANFLLNRAKKNMCKIVSVDSEIYSLSQIILHSDIKKIDRIYLTASGGPFLKKKKFIKKARIQDVLMHPNWTMGKKISVDSSNMVNKILELIEAHVLFKIPIDKLKIKIHKESLAHSAVVFKNGLVNILMHDTTMEIPIRNCLFDQSYEFQKKNYFKNTKSFELTFDENKLSNFKILKTGYDVLKLGHRAWILFNVINDDLVNKFLKKEIFYYEIVENLIKIFANKSLILYCRKKIKNINDINSTLSYGKNILKKI